MEFDIKELKNHEVLFSFDKLKFKISHEEALQIYNKLHKILYNDSTNEELEEKIYGLENKVEELENEIEYIKDNDAKHDSCFRNSFLYNM